MKEINLRDLLDTEFTINDKLEMVGTFTLDKINMIADILINLNEENEKLNNIINKVIECINYYAVENDDYSKIYNDEEKDLLNILKGDKDE